VCVYVCVGMGVYVWCDVVWGGVVRCVCMCGLNNIDDNISRIQCVNN